MKSFRIFLLALLIPHLLYALGQVECEQIHEEIKAEWLQSNTFIKQANRLSSEESEATLLLLTHALSCCQKASDLCNTILNNYNKKTRNQQLQKWRIQIKELCEEDKKTITSRIGELEHDIEELKKQLIIEKLNAIELHISLAEAKNVNCVRSLTNNTVIETLTDVAYVFQEAAKDLNQILLDFSSTINHLDKSCLHEKIESLNDSARNLLDEVSAWPHTILKQKAVLERQLENLQTKNTQLLKEGLTKNAHEVQKQMLMISEQLIKDEPGRQDLLELIEDLQTNIKFFECSSVKQPLSIEELKLIEQLKMKSFFASELFQNPNNMIQAILDSPVRCLDKCLHQDELQFTLFSGLFYRFFINSSTPLSGLRIKVYEGTQMVYEEKIELPEKTSLQYLVQEGLIHIPETNIEKNFGLELRLSHLPSVDKRGFIISQKCQSTKYVFVICTEDEKPLYSANYIRPPPWQLKALTQPNSIAINAPHFHENALFSIVTDHPPQNGQELPLSLQLNKFVKELKSDPLALTQFVYNEIELWNPLYQVDNVYIPIGIIRDPATTFLEKKGSPWEMCMLLIYLLREAGFEAYYLLDGTCLLSKPYAERLFFTEFSNQDEILLNFPGVLFHNGKEWISLFPWLKEIQVQEGYDLYSTLPDRYASADRWLQHYLANDEAILKHIGPDQDDSAGTLFVRFVEEELRKQGLSIQDIGIHRQIVKKQFSSWNDVPCPSFPKNSTWKAIHSIQNLPLFGTLSIDILSKKNPTKKTSFCQNLSYEGDFYLEFKYGENPKLQLQIHDGTQWHEIECFELDPTDQTFDLTANLKIYPAMEHSQKFSFERGASIAFCTSAGGANAQATSLAYKRLIEEPLEEKKLLNLLNFVGTAYFEKCHNAEHLLAAFHKTAPTTVYAFGLAKLCPAPCSNSLDLIFPQVDMRFYGSQNTHRSLSTDTQQFLTLFTATFSSNEHQIIKEVFQDPHAISTTKLLQLAHQKHTQTGLPGLGLLTFSSDSFITADSAPQGASTSLFPYLCGLNLSQTIQQAGEQWESLKQFLEEYKTFSYAYMTPGVIVSQNGTDQLPPSYMGVGTICFSPIAAFATISSGNIVMNGGFGSPMPPGYLDYMFQNPNPYPLLHQHFEPIKNELYSAPSSRPMVYDYDPPLFYADAYTLLYEYSLSDVRPASKPETNLIADPVDLLSGAFYIDEVDLSLPGPFPLEIRRNYSSLNPIHGTLGYGWKLSLNPGLIKEDDKLYAAEMDGTVIVYRLNPSNERYEVFPEDNPDLTNYNQQGIGGTANPFHAYIKNNILYGVDGSKRAFEEGLLKKWEDCRGNFLTFFYSNGLLSEIENSNGSYCGFHYYPDGKVSEIYAQDGRRTHYFYDSIGNLREVVLPNNARINYEYDSNHRVIRETKPEGWVLENIYDEEGRVKEQRSPVGFQGKLITSATFHREGHKVIATNAAGHSTTYYTHNNQIYKILDPEGHQILPAWFLDKQTWFDPEEECLKACDEEGSWPRSLKSCTDKRGLKTSYTYDERGNVQQLKVEGEDLSGNGITCITKEFTYNNLNLCTKEMTLNHTIFTTYDTKLPFLPFKIESYYDQTLLSSIFFTYNSKGQLEQENKSGAITIWEYDSYGFPYRKTQKTGTGDPDVITKFHYNNQGQCLQTKTHDGIYENRYDIMGNSYESLTKSLDGTLISSLSQKYNLSNQLIWQQTANPKNILLIDYSPSGLIKASRQTLVPSEAIAYTLYDYDTQGNLIELVDPLGNTTSHTYDSLDQLTTTTQENLVTTFTYEPGGALATITSPSGATTTKIYTTNGLLKEETFPDQTKNTTIYDHHQRPILQSINNVAWQIEYNDTSHQIIRTHIETQEQEIETYDSRGNLISFQDAAGYIWTNTYDHLNRIKSSTTPSHETTTWNYNQNETICHLPNGETVIEKTAAGQIVETKHYNSAATLISTTIYDYDPIQDLEALTQGQQTTFTFLNTQGQPIQIDTGDTLTSYIYDPAGNCISIIDGENRETQLTYDSLNRLQTKTLPDGAKITYGYDADSNLTTYQLPNNTTWKAQYDGMHRKVSEHLEAHGKKTQHYTYSYQNGLLKQTQDPLGRLHNYTYDSHHRLVKESVEEWARLYTYDQRGLLSTAKQTKTSFWTGPETSLIKRTYDPSGRLETETITLNSEVLQQTRQSWSPTSRTLTIQDHERQLTFQNEQLIQVSTPQTQLDYEYNTSQALSYQSTPQTETFIDYTDTLPNQIEIYLPNHTYTENPVWDQSGKLSHYKTNHFETTLNYNSRGFLTTLGPNNFAFDFNTPGTGVRTQSPNHAVHSTDSFNRPTQESHCTTTYDAQGQTVTQNNRHHEYDPWGNLIKVTDPKLTWKASYDALNRRLRTSSNKSPTTISLYDPEHEFQEIGIQTDQATYWKLYGPNSCDAIIDNAGNTVYLSHNLLGELLAITGDQTIFNQNILNPYGPQNVSSPHDLHSYALSLTWHSKAPDPTGYIYMGARTYDPFTGRFLSPDPISYPHCTDLYHFANGDPINYFDPDGRFFIKAWENPRVQGSLQTIGGTGETIAGACMSLYSGGLATPLGFAVMAHGLDHTFTGLKTIWTGQYATSATQQLLEKTGMSSNMAANTDAILGFAGGTYATRVVNSAMRSALPQFRLPANYTSSALESDQILFAQRTVGRRFSERATFSSMPLSKVVSGLRNGTISPDRIPIKIIVRDGEKITLNNRSLLVLRRAGMRPTIIIDKTGVKRYEEILNEHLRKSVPSDTIRVRGGESGTSFIGFDF